MAGDADDTAFAFGVWFGDDFPVDIHGPPAVILPRLRGPEYYEYYFRQTAPCHVAVAAFTAASRGRPSELFLEWDASPPDAPERQWAESRQNQPPQE